MNDSPLQAERRHLAGLIEAVQRCVFFLDDASGRVDWPLDGTDLAARKKDRDLFQALAALNERFAKLQDTLAAAMRHAALLLGEPTDGFLRVLAFYEKAGVIESVADWQLCRTARNVSAHDYEIDYAAIAEHFNTLHALRPLLYRAAERFTRLCAEDLAVGPADDAFASEFERITNA